MKILWLSAQLVIKTVNMVIFTLLFCRERHGLIPKCVQHVQHAYFSSLETMNFLICGIVILQLPNITELTFGVLAFRQRELRASPRNFCIVVYLQKQFDPFKFV